MRRAVAVLAVLSLAPGLAAGGERAPGASALAVELARVALPRQTWDEMNVQVSDSVRSQFDAAMRQRGVEPPAGMADALAAEMVKVMPTYQEMLDLSAGLLAKHYTASELEQLAAFYRSPLGQKAIRIQPEVMRDVLGQVQVILGQRLPPVMERLQARFSPDAVRK